MEKKKRSRKITVDTKNVDVKFEQSEDGSSVLEIDTPKIDVTVKKSASGSKQIEVEINDDETYIFESNGKSKHLEKGRRFSITGTMLKLFLERGFGKLIK